jgi:uncharacterized membrane protein
MTDQPKRFEDTPLSRAEYIAALVHLYRGEVYRATQWRLRLDTTTNWSILSVMALVTFSLGDATHSHGAILVGMAMVHTFLGIEARRFRYFLVWQQRVRLLERNFYGPIVRRDLESPIERWGDWIADDLLRPRFRIAKRQALRARLTRNYAPLFIVLLATWILKLFLHPGEPVVPILDRMALGSLPFWLAPSLITIEYAYLLWIWLAHSGNNGPMDELDDDQDGLVPPPVQS